MLKSNQYDKWLYDIISYHLTDLKNLFKAVYENSEKFGYIDSVDARILMFGTVLQESRGYYLRQITINGNGPATSILQIEPNTFELIERWLQKNYEDIYRKYQDYHSSRTKLFRTSSINYGLSGVSPIQHLLLDQSLAIWFGRLLYMSIPKPIANHKEYNNSHDYFHALGDYYKKYYNRGGKGSALSFVQHLKHAEDRGVFSILELDFKSNMLEIKE